jgi:hypothetical protein
MQPHKATTRLLLLTKPTNPKPVSYSLTVTEPEYNLTINSVIRTQASTYAYNKNVWLHPDSFLPHDFKSRLLWATAIIRVPAAPPVRASQNSTS